MRATGPCTRRLETVHLAALGVWFGALVTVSATAALAFPTMKRLQPALPGFRIDLADHPQIAAGHVMNPAFMGVMVGGAVCSLLVALGWPSFGAWRRGLCGILMLLAVGTLVGLGLGPFLAGYVSATNGDDLALGVLSTLIVVPLGLVLLIAALRLVPAAAASVLERARDAGERIA